MNKIAIIHLTMDDSAWRQATLPVKLGGLGILMVAPSAFLASSHALLELVDAILPSHYGSLPSPLLEEAIIMWLHGHNSQAPMGAGAVQQKAWDNIHAGQLAERLLNETSDDVSQGRLLHCKNCGVICPPNEQHTIGVISHRPLKVCLAHLIWCARS